MFVGDLTFVGATTSDDPNKPKKLLSNVNVLMELGYAGRSIGWERIILVMNKAFGPPEKLPFDLRNRRFPITYDVSPTNKEDLAAIEEELTGKLVEAIGACMAAEHAQVNEKVKSLDRYALQWMQDLGSHASFAPPDRKSARDVLAHQRLDDALIRLIDLRLLETKVNPSAGLYAYHWTYIGKLVLQRLCLRDG